MKFELVKKDGLARAGLLTLNHGKVNTPAFMPIGTYGSVKGVLPRDLCDFDLILTNTFHLFLSPGCDLIRNFGGIHGFISWKKSILTDSGGFQIFSLSGRVSEEGVLFKSPRDGSLIFLSPERSIEIQTILNSDIVMILDECTDVNLSKDRAASSMNLSSRWARRCRLEFDRLENKNAIYGIVHGDLFTDLRLESLGRLEDMNFDGIALGGFAVNLERSETYRVISELSTHLPEHKPRYLMGVGNPEDLIYAISKGIDQFDCVLPTRNARNGYLFTRFGDIRIKSSVYALDNDPIDSSCDCYTCKNFSRSYLRYVFKRREINSAQLNTIHNLHYYSRLMKDAREAIIGGYFVDFVDKFKSDRGV